jgi:hypothetical protein
MPKRIGNAGSGFARTGQTPLARDATYDLRVHRGYRAPLMVIGAPD